MLLCFRNRQQTRAVNLRLLRKITLCLVQEILREPDFELCIHLVAVREMAKINETFLQHHGSTDVITFDYLDKNGSACCPDDKERGQPCPRPPEVVKTPEFLFVSKRGDKAVRAPLDLDTTASTSHPALHGEIFICIEDAVKQAREFETMWQSELVRYIVHGILHLKGFDDLILAERKKMKREENRLLNHLSRRFTLSSLRRPIKTSA